MYPFTPTFRHQYRHQQTRNARTTVDVNKRRNEKLCEGELPGVHRQRRHVHLVLALERVVTCRDVMQRQRTERTAEREERERSSVALETLTLKQTNLSTDLQRLAQPFHNARYLLFVCQLIDSGGFFYSKSTQIHAITTY